MTPRPCLASAFLSLMLFAGLSAPAAASDPPKEQKKSAADLLVGSWRMVKHAGKEIPLEGPGRIIEFTAAGKMSSRATGAAAGEPQRGIYRLEGKTIQFSLEAAGDEKARDGEVEVESITEEALVTVTAGKGEKVRTEYRRRTTAEILVGTWRMVKDGDETIPQDKALISIAFTKDGKLTIQNIDYRIPEERRSPPRLGTYKLETKTLHLKTEATKKHEAREWIVTIESITEDEMVLSSPKGTKKSEFKRFVEKGKK